MLQEKVVKQKKKDILCPITCFFRKSRAVYEVMWKNTERFLAIRLQAHAESIFRV